MNLSNALCTKFQAATSWEGGVSTAQQLQGSHTNALFHRPNQLASGTPRRGWCWVRLRGVQTLPAPLHHPIHLLAHKPNIFSQSTQYTRKPRKKKTEKTTVTCLYPWPTNLACKVVDAGADVFTAAISPTGCSISTTTSGSSSLFLGPSKRAPCMYLPRQLVGDFGNDMHKNMNMPVISSTIGSL